MSDDKKLSCPVCSTHTKEDTTASMGIVIAGAKAILESDADKVKDVFATLTNYDAHIAITLYTMALLDLCQVLGGDPVATLDLYRESLNASLAAGN